MRICIRTDSSQEIGTGHVMRCITLAEALRERGAEVEFIYRGIYSLADYIKKKDFKVTVLPESVERNEEYCPHSKWLEASWQEDADETAKIAYGADWLITDHYALDERWEKALRSSVNNIAVIDDLADRKHDCDLLLDQNFYLNIENRYDELVANNCTKLLGPSYALLRNEFLEARRNLQPRSGKVDKIVVFFGGVDLNNDTAAALDALNNFKGKVTIIAGGANKNYPALEEICKGRPNFKLHKSVSNIAEIMAKSDLAIGSGGSTTWERAALGLPSICWPIADNQRKILNDLAAAGIIMLSSPEKVEADINSLTAQKLQELSDKSFVLVDGKGADKVANHIIYNLRKAEEKDSERILEIRNMQEVRENSLAQDVISYADHTKWFANSLQNPNRLVLVVEDSQPIGVLRYDINGDTATISIFLDPEYFGLGLAETAMDRGEVILRKAYPKVKKLAAEIMEHNLPSQNLFTKLGFTQTGKIWTKEI